MSFQGKLGESAATLKAALQAQSDLSSAHLAALHLCVAQGRRGPSASRANQERKQQAQDVFTALGEATAWTNPEIVALGAARVNALHRRRPGPQASSPSVCATSLRPGAAHLVAGRGAAARRRGTPLAGPQDIRDQLAASDIPRPTVTLSDGKEIRLDDQGYTLARGAPNRADRKQVFDKFWASYKAFESSLGASLATKVKGDLFAAKARHYDSALQAALDGANLPEAVYRSLIAETNRGPAGAAPLFRASPAHAGPSRHGLLGYLPAAGEVGPRLTAWPRCAS